MKRVLTVVALVALSASTASAAATPKPHLAKAKPVVPHVVFLKYRVAPADEYFGRLRLSILGIRNTLRDQGQRADADPPHATSVMGAVAMAEDAVHDWEMKYPQDTWIPGTIFSLERVYAKVDSDDARSHAKFAMAWLVRDYPRSPQAKAGRTELTQNLVGAKAPSMPNTMAAAPAAAAPAPAPAPTQ